MDLPYFAQATLANIRQLPLLVRNQTEAKSHIIASVAAAAVKNLGLINSFTFSAYKPCHFVLNRIPLYTYY
jgi:hypothetical protein